LLLRTSAAKAGKKGLLLAAPPSFAACAPVRSFLATFACCFAWASLLVVAAFVFRPLRCSLVPRSQLRGLQTSQLAKVRPAVALSFARSGFARSSLNIIISALGRCLPLSFLVRSLLPRAATPHYPHPRSSGAVVRLPQHGFGLVATGARERTERAQSPQGYDVFQKIAR